MAMILGEQNLPWEIPEMSEDYLKPLGYAKGIVLGLLHRDPAQRKTMAQCVLDCKRIVSDTSSCTVDDGSRSQVYVPCPSSFRGA